MKPLPPDLTSQDMLEGLRKYGPVEEIPERDVPGYRRTIARGIMHLVASQVLLSLRTGKKGRGSSEDVAEFYEQAYGSTSTRQVVESKARAQKLILFRVGDNSIVKIGTNTYRRFMLDRLGDIIGCCEPASICEVGCGRGANLFYLASRLPAVQCAGFDISNNAIRSARELQAMTDLPSSSLGQSLALTAADMDGIGRIDFQVGSAFSLPAADKSYDLAFTSAALEQMHSNIGAALSELRRIARLHVLLWEPFVDGTDVLGRAFLWSKNYFRMKAADLEVHGLEPIRVWTSLPRKPTFAYSFVLCRVKP